MNQLSYDLGRLKILKYISKAGFTLIRRKKKKFTVQKLYLYIFYYNLIINIADNSWTSNGASFKSSPRGSANQNGGIGA